MLCPLSVSIVCIVRVLPTATGCSQLQLRLFGVAFSPVVCALWIARCTDAPSRTQDGSALREREELKAYLTTTSEFLTYKSACNGERTAAPACLEDLGAGNEETDGCGID